MITKDQKTVVIENNRLHDTDTGSPEVQIAILTERINQLTERFIKAMHEDADALGCLRPNIEPKATEHINEMIALTEKLIKKGHAYATLMGDVYFKVRYDGQNLNRARVQFRLTESIETREAAIRRVLESM